MPTPLQPGTVKSRVENFFLDNYRDIGSIMKGVALAAATFVGLQLLREWPSTWPRAFLWGSSMLATLVSYVTWGRGVLLTNARGSLSDSVFPLFMGVVEFCLFAVLDPHEKMPPKETLWSWWFLVLGAHGLGAALLTRNRVRNTKPAEDFSEELRELGDEYLAWVKADQRGAMFCTVLAVASLLLLRLLAPRIPEWIFNSVQSALAVLFAFIFWMVIRRADGQRRRIDEVVSALVRPEHS